MRGGVRTLENYSSTWTQILIPLNLTSLLVLMLPFTSWGTINKKAVLCNMDFGDVPGVVLGTPQQKIILGDIESQGSDVKTTRQVRSKS